MGYSDYRNEQCEVCVMSPYELIPVKAPTRSYTIGQSSQAVR